MAEKKEIVLQNDSSEISNFALKAAGIGVWDLQVGKEYKVLLDDRCRELFGITTNVSIGFEEAFTYIHSDDRKEIEEAVHSALTFENGGNFDRKFRIVGVDGVTRLVKFVGQAYFDKENNPVRFSGVAMDISAEMNAREELLRLKLLIENDPDPISIAGENGKVLYLNPAFCRAIGLTLEEIRNVNAKDFYSEEELKKRHEIYKTLEESGSWKGLLTLRNFKTNEEVLFNARVERVVDPETNKNIGAIGYMRDMRPEMEAQKALLESEYKFRNVTNTSPTGLWLSDQEGNLTYLNKTLTDWTGMPYESLLGVGWANAVIEEDRGKAATAFMNAINTRGHYEVDFRITRGNGDIRWCRAAGDPFYEKDGTYGGYAGFCMDIHERRQLMDDIQLNEQRIRGIVEQAPMAIGVLRGLNFTVESANESLLYFWNKEKSVIGLPLIKALPEIEGQPFIQLLNDVYNTGIAYYGYEALAKLGNAGELKDSYFDFVYTPLKNTEGEIDGILVLASEVTSKVLAKQSLVESESKFRSLVEEAPVPTAVLVGRELVIEIANDAMAVLWGKGSSLIGHPLAEALPELKGQPFLKILDDIFVTKQAFHAKEAKAELVVDGKLQTFYFNFTYKPLFDKNGEVYAIIDMAVDVTDQVENKMRLAENAARLRIAVETANLGTWELNPVTNELTISDRIKNWLGYKKEDSVSFDDMMKCLSEKEIFINGIEKAKENRNNGKLDIEYTIVNRDTNNKHIVHTVGQVFFNENGKPYLLTGSSKDITVYRNTQMQLENLIQERTEELQASTEELQSSNEELGATNEELAESNENLYRSNEELAQYAYVASHDLQEPLRKIRVFTSMLASQPDLSEKNKPLVGKINKAAERMTLLIKDVLEFSRLINSEKITRTVSLTQAIDDVVNDFELVINEKNATVKINSDLPTIPAVGLQMNQLFYNLINNALKFSRPEVNPVIEIKSRILTTQEISQHILRIIPNAVYYEIAVKDNGIGFDTKYSELIFEVFKRLHGREHYEGSGIGLALCRRIVANHGGYLYAKSGMGEGSVFYIILPDRNK